MRKAVQRMINAKDCPTCGHSNPVGEADCTTCGHEFGGAGAPAARAKPAPAVSGGGLGQAFGGLLFLAGVAGAVYYFRFFETTVETGLGRIGNLPLMHRAAAGDDRVDRGGRARIDPDARAAAAEPLIGAYPLGGSTMRNATTDPFRLGSHARVRREGSPCRRNRASAVRAGSCACVSCARRDTQREHAVSRSSPKSSRGTSSGRKAGLRISAV